MHTTTIFKITIEVCGADLENHFAIAAQSIINYSHSSIGKKKHFFATVAWWAYLTLLSSPSPFQFPGPIVVVPMSAIRGPYSLQ